MISRIEVRRYRCFDELELEPGSFNVLAGANGSGKSTLLDVPILLGDLLPYLPSVPRLLVVEEPETAIHPRGLENVLQSLMSLYESQVWVSSHSSQVLAHTRPDQLLCFQLDDEGRSTVVPGDRHPRLRDWQGSAGFQPAGDEVPESFVGFAHEPAGCRRSQSVVPSHHR